MEKIQEMVAAAQKGDMDAFGWLYEETYNRNYYIVIKMVKQEQDAMDILQDAYVKVFRSLHSFRYNGSQSFASWTSKIASNTALDFLRKKNPVLFSQMQTEDGEELPVPEPEDESVENQPELALDRKETAQIVQELLECLSEEQRICVILKYVREMKVSEIAAECGCSENTVKSRLSYAKKRLLGERETLEKKGVRLYNVAPFTLLTMLLGKEADVYPAPEMSTGISALVEQALDGQTASVLSAQSAGDATEAGKAVAAEAGKTAAGWGAGKLLAVVALLLAGVGAGAAIVHMQAQKEKVPAVVAEAPPETEDALLAEEPEAQDEDGLSDSPAEQAPSDAEAKAAFDAFLQTGRWTDSDIIYEPSELSFYYTRVGKDETPVLLAQFNEAAHAYGYVAIYQYVDGEAVCISSDDWIDILFAESGVIALGRMGGGYGATELTYYKQNDDGIFEECAYTAILSEESWGDEYEEMREMNGPDVYQIGEQDVTEEKFAAFLEEIRDGDENTASGVEFVQNTAENREKYLR